MSAASTLLGVPAFLVAVFVFYWSLCFSGLFQQVAFLKLWGKRRDNFGWAALLCTFFRVKFRKATKEELYRGGPCVYLCNHRSWADFFVDTYLTEGRAQLLSRMLVLYVFPVFMLAVEILRGVILFKRGRVVDKEKFNSWLDAKMARSPCPAILVFPEGTRSTRKESLPLKRGMLHFAFSRRLPVQLLVSGGKDNILSEKKLRVRLNSVVTTALSPPIQPADFPDFEAFFQHICSTWLQLWQVAFAEQPADAPTPNRVIFHGPHLPQYDYVWSVKFQIFVWSLVSFPLMGATVYYSSLAALWLLRLLGPLGPPLVGLTALYTAVSFLYAGILG